MKKSLKWSLFLFISIAERHFPLWFWLRTTVHKHIDQTSWLFLPFPCLLLLLLSLHCAKPSQPTFDMNFWSHLTRRRPASSMSTKPPLHSFVFTLGSNQPGIYARTVRSSLFDFTTWKEFPLFSLFFLRPFFGARERKRDLIWYQATFFSQLTK